MTVTAESLRATVAAWRATGQAPDNLSDLLNAPLPLSALLPLTDRLWALIEEPYARSSLQELVVERSIPYFGTESSLDPQLDIAINAFWTRAEKTWNISLHRSLTDPDVYYRHQQLKAHIFTVFALAPDMDDQVLTTSVDNHDLHTSPQVYLCSRGTAEMWEHWSTRIARDRIDDTQLLEQLPVEDRYSALMLERRLAQFHPWDLDNIIQGEALFFSLLSRERLMELLPQLVAHPTARRVIVPHLERDFANWTNPQKAQALAAMPREINTLLFSFLNPGSHPPVGLR